MFVGYVIDKFDLSNIAGQWATDRHETTSEGITSNCGR